MSKSIKRNFDNIPNSKILTYLIRRIIDSNVFSGVSILFAVPMFTINFFLLPSLSSILDDSGQFDNLHLRVILVLRKCPKKKRIFTNIWRESRVDLPLQTKFLLSSFFLVELNISLSLNFKFYWSCSRIICIQNLSIFDGKD